MLQNYSNRKFPPNFICILCDEATGEGSETQYGGKYGSAGEACGSHTYYAQERIFQSNLNVSSAIERIEAELPATKERDEILLFVRNSRRGIIKGSASILSVEFLESGTGIQNRDRPLKSFGGRSCYDVTLV